MDLYLLKVATFNDDIGYIVLTLLSKLFAFKLFAFFETVF